MGSGGWGLVDSEAGDDFGEKKTASAEGRRFEEAELTIRRPNQIDPALEVELDADEAFGWWTCRTTCRTIP